MSPSVPSLPAVSRRKFLVGAAGTAAVTALPLIAGGAEADAAPVTQTLVVQDTDSSIKYTGAWSRFGGLNSTTWYGGHATSSLTKGDSLEYAHPQCAQLRWRATKGPDRGIARVYVDGRMVTTVDTYAPAVVAQAVLFDSGPLTAGHHVLSIEVSGRKNSSSSSTWIECNAIEVVAVAGVPFAVDDTYPTLVYAGAWSPFVNVPGRLNGTVHSTSTAGASMAFAHPNCSRITLMGSVDSDRGQADIYVDGIFARTVDQYSATANPSTPTFDTGPLTPGPHALTVVTRGTMTPPSRATWFEIDHIIVDGDPAALDRVHASSSRVMTDAAAGATPWASTTMPAAIGGSVYSSSAQGSALLFHFVGDTVAVQGSKQAGGGIAEFWVDGVLQASVDTYAATTQWGQELFRKTGLAADTTHSVRVVVSGKQNASATGAALFIEAFDATKIVELRTDMAAQAAAEVATIAAGTKPYLARGSWSPVSYVASAPVNNVALQGSGPLSTCFTNNINYLNNAMAYSSPNHVSSDTFWTANWPGANEGRLLAGAAHTLRWGERSDMRAIVNAMVQAAKNRQSAAGDCMPYPASAITPPVGGNDIERPNYDRAMWTRGMVAAVLVNATDAATVLRKHYDWFNNWGTSNLGQLISGSLGLQGHVGSTLTYFSSVGKPEDMETAERFYIQDWWLEQMRTAQPLSVSSYPLDRPHSYDIIAVEAYLDHYRATGAQKYIDAVLGAWDLFSRYFTYNGNGTSITEGGYLPPSSAHLDNPNNEGCGSVFWIDLNHRLHQLFPDQEKYVAEIERYLFNVCLAQQADAAPWGIRYHANYEGTKESPTNVSTCDEVTETGLYARLPQYIYSIDRDGGLWINLYESSQITWGSATLNTTTTFPYDPSVSHSLTLSAGPKTMKLRVRVPKWASAPVAIKVNGSTVATGTPGSYVVLDRTWASGDTISYTLPMAHTLQRYTGVTQFNGMQRYCLQYGPVLLALTGIWDSTYRQSDGSWVPRLRIDPTSLPGALTPKAGAPLQWTVNGTQLVYKPYWKIQSESLSCYPIITP